MAEAAAQDMLKSPLPPPREDTFDTRHLEGDLKVRAIRAGGATMLGQSVKFVLQTASMVILARLLTPADFGLVGMVMAVTTFIMMFKDMGLSAATIQRPEINHSQISTLFWINVGIGVGLAVLTVALAPGIAWFYGEPKLTAVAMVLGAAFIFSGLTIQHQALLKRNMRFGSIASIEVFAMAIAVVAAVLAAWTGAGYWSLVVFHVSMAGAIALGVWVVSGWWPGAPRRGTGVRGMLAFGRDVTAFHVVNYFARNVDKILIGRFWGSSVLGLYGRAYSLLMLPISQVRAPLTSVAVPALSRIQDDPQRYRSYYTKLVLLLSFLSMPLTVFLAICSTNVILLLLGDQWLGAARIFQILAISAFIQPVSTTRGSVLLSTGQSGRFLRWGLLNSIVVVVSFVVGIPWGAIGVAAAYAVAEYLILLPSLWYCFRKAPVSMADFFRGVGRPVASSCAMGAAILATRFILISQSNIVIIVACLLIGAAMYLGSWVLLPGGVCTLREMGSYLPLVFRRGD